MTSPDRTVVGVDFGTLSARALVVRVRDGAELGTAVSEYDHAVLESALPSGRALPPDWALQVPADYVASLGASVRGAVADAGIDPSTVVGIGTDFTACTVIPTLGDGTPLCELPELTGRGSTTQRASGRSHTAGTSVSFNSGLRLAA